MDALSSDIRVADMIDDRSADGIFRVDRDIYLNPEVFEAELKAIFESNWICLLYTSDAADEE